MRTLVAITALSLVLSTLPASAILMQKQRFDVMGYCGDAIRKYCPKVDMDSLDALWACLSPHFLGTNPLCKATLQEIQGN